MEFSVDELTGLTAKIVHTLKRWRFGTKAQLAFLEDLFTLINDGIPANRAVEMMAQISTGLTRDVAMSLAQKIAQGQPLADGMRDWFALNVVEIIRVGEAGGALPQTLKSAINMLAQQGIAVGAFVGALIYPLIVIVMGCVIIVYLNNSVFVQFRYIKPIEQWPASGQRFVTIANFLQNWWWAIILAIIALILIYRRVVTNYVGELRPTLDQIPPFSFYRQLAAARFLETLGLLVENGVVFKAAIKVMQYQSNPYLAYHLVMMEHLLSMGKTNIADVLATGLIEDHDLMRLRIMAEVKGFEHGLIRMGIRGTDHATQTIKIISRVTGGVLLVIGAALIIVIVQGVYLTGMTMGAQS